MWTYHRGPVSDAKPFVKSNFWSLLCQLYELETKWVQPYPQATAKHCFLKELRAFVNYFFGMMWMVLGKMCFLRDLNLNRITICTLNVCIFLWYYASVNDIVGTVQILSPAQNQRIDKLTSTGSVERARERERFVPMSVYTGLTCL